MIDLKKLVISKGDIVQCKKIKTVQERTLQTGKGYEPGKVFTVEFTKIVNGKQVLYPVVGHGVYNHEVDILGKADSMSNGQKNQLMFTEVLNSMYGENWDFTTVNRGSSSFRNCIVIRYPELTLENSHGSKHTIYELYVALTLSSDYGISRSSLYGTRRVCTEMEEGGNYRHSHLSGTCYESFSEFCTGGDVITQLLMSARDKGIEIYKYRDLVETLFETLNTFVAWESLEGGPYRHMENIGGRNNRMFTSHNPFRVTESQSNRYVQQLVSNGKLDISIDVDISDNSIKGVFNMVKINTDELDKLLVKNIITDRPNFISYPLYLTNVGIGSRAPRNYSLQFFADIIERENAEEVEVEGDKREEWQVLSNLGNFIIFRGEQLRYQRIAVYNNNNTTNNNSEISKLRSEHIRVDKSLLFNATQILLTNFYKKLYGKEEQFITDLISGGAEVISEDEDNAGVQLQGQISL